MRTRNQNSLKTSNNYTVPDQPTTSDIYSYEAMDQRKSAYSFTFSTEMCIIIHGVIIASLFVVTIARYVIFLKIVHLQRFIKFYLAKESIQLICRSIGFFAICVQASQKLHNDMFKGIVSVSMRFFDINPSGRILTRFSRDIG